MELQIILSIVGSLSSAIAAICAVVTVGITIKSIKDDRHEQKRERQTRKLSELYKKTVIDSVLKTVEKKILRSIQLLGCSNRKTGTESIF